MPRPRGGHPLGRDEPARLTDVLPDEAWLLALASLPAVGPRRLWRILEQESGHDAAQVAWTRVLARDGVPCAEPAGAAGEEPLFDGSEVGSRTGTPRADLRRQWADAAAAFDVAHAWQRHRQAKIHVLGLSTPLYPRQALVDDPMPPAALFVRGDMRVLDGPRVAIVGTRDCTVQGHDFAFELGRDLAANGVRVVSGLALGIDGAAHAGALDASSAPPIAVVGSGPDVIYPRRHGSLWRAVASRGALISEHPLGVAPTAWHFPARNRLIAALADVVVVVESHERGGSLQTAREALVRNREVMAVPGPVRSKAAAGANLLLRDGAGVCLGADDVFALLGLSCETSTRSADPRVAPQGPDGDVLRALGGQTSSVEQLVLRTGMAPTDVATSVNRLEDAGWLVERGGWYEVAGRGD